MRFAAITTLALLLSALCAPASWAQNNAVQAGQSTNGHMVFGGFSCRQQLPCDLSDPIYAQSAQVIAFANACIAQNMGISSPDGIFDESAGLDSDGCLTTKTDSFQAAGKTKPSIPRCCIGAIRPGECYLQCNLISQ